MRKYTYIFANDRHEKIHTMAELKALGRHDPKLALLLNGKAIGEGALIIQRPGTGKNVHTEYVRLDDKYRRKGHGIHLYLALIKAAKRIGAARIYSSTNLNNQSRRMWSEKLGKFHDVRKFVSRRRCRRCGCTNRRAIQFYIVLKKRK